VFRLLLLFSYTFFLDVCPYFHEFFPLKINSCSYLVFPTYHAPPPVVPPPPWRKILYGGEAAEEKFACFPKENFWTPPVVPPPGFSAKRGGGTTGGGHGIISLKITINRGKMLLLFFRSPEGQSLFCFIAFTCFCVGFFCLLGTFMPESPHHRKFVNPPLSSALGYRWRIFSDPQGGVLNRAYRKYRPDWICNSPCNHHCANLDLGLGDPVPRYHTRT